MVRSLGLSPVLLNLPVNLIGVIRVVTQRRVNLRHRQIQQLSHRWYGLVARFVNLAKRANDLPQVGTVPQSGPPSGGSILKNNPGVLHPQVLFLSPNAFGPPNWHQACN